MLTSVTSLRPSGRHQLNTHLMTKEGVSVRFLQSRNILIGCLILASILKVVCILNFSPKPISDCKAYFNMAVEIAQGNGYKRYGKLTAYRPVGYPALLGLLFSIFGTSLLAPKLFNVLFSVWTLYFVYHVSEDLFKSKPIATINVLILSFYPQYIYHMTLLFSETFHLFLVMLGIYLLVKKRSSIFLKIASGIVFGLACLVKPNTFFVPVLFLLPDIFINKNKYRANKYSQIFKIIIIVYFAIVVIILPWIIRNYMIFKQFSLISTNGGANLFIGNNPHSTGKYIWNEGMTERINNYYSKYRKDNRSSFRDLNEIERDSLFWEYSINYILHNPVKTIKLWPKKIKYFFTPGPGLNQIVDGSGKDVFISKRKKIPISFLFTHKYSELFLDYLLYLFLFSLILSLLIFYKWGKIKKYPIHGIIMTLYSILISIIFFGNGRFNYLIIPWLSMYIASFIYFIIIKFKQQKTYLNAFLQKIIL